MPQASVKRLIEADKQKLIELVLDIEKYKDFIPYCLDSKKKYIYCKLCFKCS